MPGVSRRPVTDAGAPPVPQVRRDRPPHPAGRHQAQRAGPGGHRLQSGGAGTFSVCVCVTGETGNRSVVLFKPLKTILATLA